MKFYDQVSIIVESGKGGDGIATGRREKGEARGGPAGGNGGRGGSIFFVASKDEYTLLTYKYRKKFKAKGGGPGQGSDKYGADAEDILLPVPLGTLIKEKETGRILAHLQENGEKYRIVSGGKGGIGNIHFTNPSNQYPTMFLLGEPGVKKEIMLELQLLGDVALIGTPSVGKSTLINAVSNVKAKTAAYEFTTLVPNIGVIKHKNKSFVMVDVPGLIEGASGGKGLGIAFLRHILKARIWTIMLDAVKDLPGIEDWSLLLAEIIQYIDKRFYKSKEFGKEIEQVKHHFMWENALLQYEARGLIDGEWKLILKKTIITIVNKSDVLDDELREEYADALVKEMVHVLIHRYDCKIKKNELKKSLLHLSALMREYIDDFLNLCIQLLSTSSSTSFLEHEEISIETSQNTYITNITDKEKPFLLEEGYINEKEHKKTKIWEMYDADMAYLTFVIPRGNDEAELRYRKTLQEKGYLQSFEKKGIRRGDIFKIISPYEGTDDRYVLWN